MMRAMTRIILLGLTSLHLGCASTDLALSVGKISSGAGLTAGAPGRADEAGSIYSNVTIYSSSSGPFALFGSRLYRLDANGSTTDWGSAPPVGIDSALSIGETQSWAVGDGIARYASGTWALVPTPIDNHFGASEDQILLTDIDVASASVGYTVGTRGTVLRYDGTTWSVESNFPLKGNLGSVKIVSNSEVWVAGEGLARFDGTQWATKSLPVGVSAISGLAIVGPDEFWASAGDRLLHWKGTWIAADTFSPGRSVGAPQLASPTSGWALEPGVAGGLLYSFQSGTWQAQSGKIPSSLALDALTTAGSSTLYATSYDGSGLYFYQNGFWARVLP